MPVILKDIEGFSQEEIAQIMKRPLGTVKARINRGRNYLKIELEKASCVENSFTKKEEYQDGCA
jgi:RNA polymerase sigma-70 factor (ECF subfamily)